MRRLSVLAVAAGLLTLSALAQAQTQVRLIRLEAPEDLALAKQLDGTINRLSGAITACVDGGRALVECQCAAREAFRSVGLALDEAVKLKPDWNSEDAVLYWEENGRSINLVVAAIRRSLVEVATRCPSR